MAQTINGSGVIDIKNQSYVIKGGKGDDTIIGGNGNDTITGGKGTNTIIYGIGDGNDVYNLTKGENLVLELRDVNVTFDWLNQPQTNIKVAYAENKKDILVYADYENHPDEFITIKNFADKDQTNSAIIRYGNDEVGYYTNDLKTLMYYTEVNADFTGTALNDKIDASGYYVEGHTAADRGLVLNAGNGINDQIVTGSQYSDTIYAGKITDPINEFAFNEIDAGAGNDVIVCAGSVDKITGGKGNDTITGGTGSTELFYFAGDGHDVVNLTKGEQFEISFIDSYWDYTCGKYSKMPNLGYEKAENGKDLIIWVDKDNHDEGSITIKDFITKDITNNANKKSADTSYVGLTYFDKDGNRVDFDLRKNLTLFAETTENFTGTWLNDKIDASGATEGLKLNGGNGNDTIIGGAGKDTITGGTGENTVVYGKDSGNDIVNLTKGEKLTVELTGVEDYNDINIKYAANKKDILIYADKNNTDEYITLKNYATTSTAKNSTVELLVNGERKDLYVLTEATKNYTGTMLNDVIDASEAYLTKTVKVNGKKDVVEKAVTDKGLTLNGGAGNDTIIGTKYSDTIKGGDGNDVINGGTGNDNLYGGKGNDIISSGSGKNTIYGEAGNDIINVTEGENVVYGGKDNDVINTSLNAKNTYVFNNKDGHDVINVNSNNPSLSGDIQSDIIKLTGVKQNGFSVTTDGDDVIISYNADKKGVYQDSVTISDYLKSSADLKDITIVTKDKKQTSLNELLKGQFTEGRELSSSTAYETFYGSFANDTIKSSGGYTTIYGGEGDDVISSNAANCEIYGGDGNDDIYSSGGSTIYGGKGDDVIKTNSYAHDVLVFENGDGNDVIEETVKFSRNSEADIIKLTGVDKDGFTQKISGNDLVISYNADSEGNYQDSITIKDFLKNPDDIPNYKIVTKDGYESTANLEYLKEEVANWLTTYCYDDVASGLADNHENAIYELNNTFMTANNEQIIPGLV